MADARGSWPYITRPRTRRWSSPSRCTLPADMFAGELLDRWMNPLDKLGHRAGGFSLPDEDQLLRYGAIAGSLPGTPSLTLFSTMRTGCPAASSGR